MKQIEILIESLFRGLKTVSYQFRNWEKNSIYYNKDISVLVERISIMFVENMKILNVRDGSLIVAIEMLSTDSVYLCRFIFL